MPVNAALAFARARAMWNLRGGNMRQVVKRSSRGQGLVEYALIIALVAVVVIAALIILGPAIANIFDNISSAL